MGVYASLCVFTETKPVKIIHYMTTEQLESNLFTKYAAGLMEDDELNTLETWLKNNPQFKPALAIISQQVSAITPSKGAAKNTRFTP